MLTSIHMVYFCNDTTIQFKSIGICQNNLSKNILYTCTTPYFLLEHCINLLRFI